MTITLSSSDRTKILKAIDGLRGSQMKTAFLLADGFGRVTEQTLIEQGWDWSHVRDSSDVKLAHIAVVVLGWQFETRGRLIELVARPGAD